MSRNNGNSKRTRPTSFDDSEIEVLEPPTARLPVNPEISEVQNLQRQLETLRREMAQKDRARNQEVHQLRMEIEAHVKKYDDRAEEVEAAFEEAARRTLRAEADAAALRHQLGQGGNHEVLRLREELANEKRSRADREAEMDAAFKLAGARMNEEKKKAKSYERQFHELRERGENHETHQLREEVAKLQQELDIKDRAHAASLNRYFKMQGEAEAENVVLRDELAALQTTLAKERRDSGAEMKRIEKEAERNFHSFVEKEHQRKMAEEKRWNEKMEKARKEVEEAKAEKDKANRAMATLHLRNQELERRVEDRDNYLSKNTETRDEALDKVKKSKEEKVNLQTKLDMMHQEVEDLKNKYRKESKKVLDLENEIRELRGEQPGPSTSTGNQ